MHLSKLHQVFILPISIHLGDLGIAVPDADGDYVVTLSEPPEKQGLGEYNKFFKIKNNMEPEKRLDIKEATIT